jgi:hypothetical protein
MAAPKVRTIWFYLALLAVAVQGVTPDANDLASTVGFRMLFALVGGCDEFDLGPDVLEVASEPTRFTRQRDAAEWPNEATLDGTPASNAAMRLQGGRGECAGLTSRPETHERILALGRLRC